MGKGGPSIKDIEEAVNRVIVGKESKTGYGNIINIYTIITSQGLLICPKYFIGSKMVGLSVSSLNTMHLFGLH